MIGGNPDLIVSHLSCLLDARVGVDQPAVAEHLSELSFNRLLVFFAYVAATALNMSNMIGIGPFITIPLLMSALGGPQAMLGWLVAVLVIHPRRHGLERARRRDARVGRQSYVYLREAFGREDTAG